MARISEAELERLKTEVSVQRLVEASGLELKKGGKDFIVKCPYHEDEKASLVVTPHKNLWHCFGCQIGGGPIDWVIKSCPRRSKFAHALLAGVVKRWAACFEQQAFQHGTRDILLLRRELAHRLELQAQILIGPPRSESSNSSQSVVTPKHLAIFLSASAEGCDAQTSAPACYPNALTWGTKNTDQHAAFQAMWAQYDHIIPHGRDGTNDVAARTAT
jgi:hypothetical protein